MTYNQKNEYNTIIIGAGISGLSCASVLSERGIKCVVLEQSDYVGGNVVSHEGLDMGSMFIGRKYWFFKWLWSRSGYSDKLVKMNCQMCPQIYVNNKLGMINSCMENGVPIISKYNLSSIRDKRVHDYTSYETELQTASMSIGTSSREMHADIFAPLYTCSGSLYYPSKGIHEFVNHLVSKYSIQVLLRCMVIYVCRTRDGDYLVSYIHGCVQHTLRCRNVVFATDPSKFGKTSCSDSECSEMVIEPEAIKYTSIVSVVVKCDKVTMNCSHTQKQRSLKEPFIIQERFGKNIITAINLCKRGKIVFYISGTVDTDRIQELIMKCIGELRDPQIDVFNNPDNASESRIVWRHEFSEAVPLVTNVDNFNRIRKCIRERNTVGVFYCGQYTGTPTLETAVYTGLLAGFSIETKLSISHIPSRDVYRDNKLKTRTVVYTILDFVPFLLGIFVLMVTVVTVIYGLIQ